MANKPQLKAVGEQGFGESDPFAELTRIMGFDPRIQPTPRPEDDFQIDLEKELMGEFGDADADRNDALPRAGLSAADLPRSASDGADAHLEQPAVVPQPTDDLEDALTSAFQQELGEESGVHAFADGPGEGDTREEEAFLPREDEVAVSADEPPSAWTDGEPAVVDETPSGEAYSAESASHEPPVAGGVIDDAVEDRGPELAESLKAMLSDAGYRSGSSFSGTAQVYEIRTSYVTPSPAADDAARIPASEDASNPSEAALPEDSLDLSAEPRSTVFGTTAPEWTDNSFVPSVPAAFEAASEENETDDVIEPEQAISPEPSARSENVEEQQEDPFAVLAALGSEQSREAFGQPNTPAPAAEPSAARPSIENRRFEGAARFYSSPDLFSRATPVVPGMRQPQRVSLPVAPAEAQAPEIPAQTAFSAEEEKADFAATEEVPDNEPAAGASAEVHQSFPDDALEMEMQDAIAAFADAAAERSGSPAEAAPHARVDGDGASSVRPAIASMPEIETVDVPEPAIAIADDLDIPTPPVEETPPPAPAFDDIDNEFVAAFSGVRPSAQAAAPASPDEDAELTARIEELFSAEEFDFSEQAPPAAVAANAGVAARTSPEGRYEPEDYALGNDYYDARPAYADIPEEPAAYPSSRLIAVRDRRGPLVAAVIGCVVIAGAVGAFAYSHYSAKESGPVLLKADAHPVKMKPKHPGGITVPNQNNQVYRRVADGDVPAPVEQQKLVTSVEKPVDLGTSAKNAAPSDMSASALPGVEMPNIPKASSQEIAALAKAAADQPQKNQDRVPASRAVGTDTSRADDVIAVEPRKVRTMIVKPDGTMVPTPMPEAVESAAPKSVASAALEEPAAKVLPGVKSEAATEHLQKPGPRAGNGAVVTPQHVDVAPSRPAEQPVTIKEPARDEKVASLKTEPAHPAAATAAASGWAMQIASQPSAAAAQTSYQHLAHRYGSVLGGHGVDIVKAEIAGKGTYYRVRVPAPSREEAINLCTKYKAAGGNCFVSR